MSKVFRLYKEGTNTYQGWNENPTFPYNSTARDTVEDPDGASAKNEITSIPSPFARIDLVKTAFREVNKRAERKLNDLSGTTIFHKMVSDALDVGEIFFNIDKLKEQVEIITWDVDKEIDLLRQDASKGHGYVADAFQKFLKSDSQTYNFDACKNIYLLNYKQGPDELNIIGATSPATLFFSTANDLSYIDNIYFADNDRPFDNQYQPLFRRDPEWLKAWWVLRRTIPNFSTLFPEIDTYLGLTFKALTDPALKEELQRIDATHRADFDTIDVQGSSQINQVEVLGHLLLKKQSGVRLTSEFTLQSSLCNTTPMPLVLPTESGNKYADLLYVSGKWGKDNHAPYHCDCSIEQRTLPFDGSPHPYLTLNDFLEEAIVQVPHQLNAEAFFDGYLTHQENGTSFLLPIKPLYFRYFTPEDLQGKCADGRPRFELEVVAGGSVRAILRIPIVGNDRQDYVEYQRIYYKDSRAQVSASENRGGMLTFSFTGMVMPGRRFHSDADACYTVACVSSFSSQFRMSFYRNGMVLPNIPMDCRNTKPGQHDFKAETYTLDKTNFDFIRITNREGQGNLLLPKLPLHQDHFSYEFAIDLGTSNTHIEYRKVGDKSSVPFDYDSQKHPLYARFFVPNEVDVQGKKVRMDLITEEDLIEADFLPASVGENSEFSFPMRTVLSHARGIDWQQKLRVYGLMNVNFIYNKKRPLDYNDTPLLNIKWGQSDYSQAAMQAYIHQLMRLIRDKVVAENGSLPTTKIIWFYPNSMSRKRLVLLKNAWNEAYKTYFNPEGETLCMSESVAPTQYYFRRYSTATNLINIDIGGGTTDISFSSANGKVDGITSFKFAANSLFEDAFSNINPSNGIVDWFAEHQFAPLLKGTSEMSDLANIFRNNIDHPADMASFLFSLKDHKATRHLDKRAIDFHQILQQDDKFKLPFIIFYTAIIYHVAQVVKAKGLKLPRHIAFSGNGSKLVTILSPEPQDLVDFTKVIFEQVLGRPFDEPLDLLGLESDSNPKEATCKGGLIAESVPNAQLENVVLQDANGTLADATFTYASIDAPTKARIVDSVAQFFTFCVEDLPKQFDLNEYFGVDQDSLRLVQQRWHQDLETYLEKGLELAQKDANNLDAPVVETLSFFPIMGALQALSADLQQYYQQQ